MTTDNFQRHKQNKGMFGTSCHQSYTQNPIIIFFVRGDLLILETLFTIPVNPDEPLMQPMNGR